MLFAVPNVSEGRDPAAIIGLEQAFASVPGVRLLDTHSDPDHHRSVFWLAGEPGLLAEALVQGAREAVGLDRPDPAARRAPARRRARRRADRLRSTRRSAAPPAPRRCCSPRGSARRSRLPVYLYGELAGGRTRAELRRGGLKALRTLAPDFGPRDPDPRRGAVLVAARPPLVAFNFEIERRRGAGARDRGRRSGSSRASARSGLWLDSAQVAQVSVNVEDPAAVPLAGLLEEVAVTRPRARGRAGRPGARRGLRRLARRTSRSATGGPSRKP